MRDQLLAAVRQRNRAVASIDAMDRQGLKAAGGPIADLFTGPIAYQAPPLEARTPRTPFCLTPKIRLSIMREEVRAELRLACVASALWGVVARMPKRSKRWKRGILRPRFKKLVKTAAIVLIVLE